MSYKRNQIEKAISRVFEASTKSASLRIRLKRLLETDRRLGRSKRSADPVRANFAFYSKEGPGRGSEVWFSSYEAFALLTGLRLMHHGWPQRFTVAALRATRPKLEKYHARILEQDPASEKLNTQKPRAGDLAVTHANPAFLAIRSVGHEDRSYDRSCAICAGQEELMRSILAQGPGQTWTILELAASARVLRSELAKTKPSKRGRGAE
jgi:hypothetical protein